MPRKKSAAPVNRTAKDSSRRYNTFACISESAVRDFVLFMKSVYFTMHFDCIFSLINRDHSAPHCSFLISTYCTTITSLGTRVLIGTPSEISKFGHRQPKLTIRATVRENFEHVYYIKYFQGWKQLSTASHSKLQIFHETGQIATEIPPP